MCYSPRHSKRECTDVGCLATLLAFLYGLWVIYANARIDGNLAKLTHGFDWKGDICGVDHAVEDRPLLFWCAPGASEELSLLDGVCVARCPTDATTRSWCPGKALPFEFREPGADGTRAVVIGTARNLTLQDDYASTEAFGYCFPKQNLALLHRIMDGTHVSTFTKQIYIACHGVLESWRFLIGVAAACIVIGYAFLLVLWFCFAKLVYLLVFAAHVLLLLCSALLVYAGFHDEYNFFTAYCERSTAHVFAWTGGAVTFAVWLLYVLLCCYSKGAVKVTIESVKASCEVITQLPTMLLQPLVHSVVVTVSLLMLVYGFAWVLSTGNIVPETGPMRQGGVEVEGIHRNIEFSGRQWACICYWAFGIVWIFETVNALGQFAISHAVVIYACFETTEWFPMLHGYFAGLVFHLGTLAYGGFVIGCLKIVAAVLSFLVRQSWDERGVQGIVTRVLCCCCAQCFVCIERVLTMVNDLVYTDVALRAVGYTAAAENVVRIAASSPATYVAIKGSATAVRVLGVSTIGGLGTFLSYLVLSSTAFHRQLDGIFEGASSMLVTSNIMGTTIAAGLVSFYIAMAFMMVFYQTTYSLMYCMLIGVVTMGDDDADGVAAVQRREMRTPRASAKY